MHTQSQTKSRPLNPRLPLELELLDEDLDENQYHYIHGLSDNVDQYQNKHFAYDIENDGQEFYHRLRKEAHFKQIYL